MKVRKDATVWSGRSKTDPRKATETPPDDPPLGAPTAHGQVEKGVLKEDRRIIPGPPNHVLVWIAFGISTVEKVIFLLHTKYNICFTPTFHLFFCAPFAFQPIRVT